MAPPPILTLADVGLSFGGAALLDGVTLAVHPGERACLVGRNGSGKSTLLKLMAGLVEPDGGTRFVRPGLRIGYMAQDPGFAGFDTLRAFAEEGTDPAEAYRVDMALDTVGLDGGLHPDKASGGERRRAALARILAEAPDLMLLDEPTNHLDIAAVLRLERHLAETRAAFVLISHDRAFLRSLTTRTLWVDRGEVRQIDRGFDAFEEWRDKIYEEEEQARHKLDRLIRSEARWAVEGISARRRRNQGRVRRLAELRAARRAQIARTGIADLDFASGEASGRLVIDARDISKGFGGKTVVRGFSLRVQRGERVALIGPNGAGKTTLLRMLIGELDPDAGTIRLGTNLALAVFDQNRARLDPGATLWDTLTGDAALGASGGGNDQILVRGQPRHVVGYLKEFLFAEAQARQPVSALSGGERARLLLALLMARESNLLVLDEPTNDLDVETLDLLQERIDGYSGTVLLVSHDRDFLDRVATTTVAMEGDGRAEIYAGGWTDYLAQARPADAPESRRQAQRSPTPARASVRDRKLSFKQAHRLETLPAEMERLGADIARLGALLADPDLYRRDPEKFEKAGAALAARQEALAAAETEWLELEELRETIENASD